jgi:hypothetical protein
MRHGLCTGPVALVWLPPERQKNSQCALPAMVPPASSTRRATVASISGTKPSSVEEPFIIGTPASAMLSFSTTLRPLSGPLAAPRMSVLTYQALSLFSSADGRRPGVRGYTTSGRKSGN